jgi:hypothetical protein
MKDTIKNMEQMMVTLYYYVRRGCDLSNYLSVKPVSKIPIYSFQFHIKPRKPAWLLDHPLGKAGNSNIFQCVSNCVFGMKIFAPYDWFGSIFMVIVIFYCHDSLCFKHGIIPLFRDFDML